MDRSGPRKPHRAGPAEPEGYQLRSHCWPGVFATLKTRAEFTPTKSERPQDDAMRFPRAAPEHILRAVYSSAVLDHFKNPRNAGELPDATATVEVSNPVCGDIMQLAARVEGRRIV